MKITLTLTDPDMSKNAAALHHLANLLRGSEVAAEYEKQYPISSAAIYKDDEEETSHINVSDLKAAPAEKKTRAKKEKAPKEETVKYTLDGNIIPAFQAYAKKYTRDAAAKILAQFNVKSVRDLPEASFVEVLKALEA